MVALARVCEVYPAGGERGSGTLIAAQWVLTSAHVVGDIGTAVGLRCFGRDGSFDGTVEWRRRDEGVDAALIRITDPKWVPPNGLPALRWGQLVCAIPVKCQAVGFPAVTAEVDFYNTSQVTGTINPLSLVKTGRIDVEVTSAPEPPPKRTDGEASAWEGLSGAGLFCGPLLVGVIAQDSGGFAGRRLTAVPVTAVLDDPQAAALLWGEHRPPDPHPVGLDRLQNDPVPVTTPASLLRADAEVARFRGRDDALTRLTKWCVAEAPLAGYLITGGGGQGKTRLAREFGHRIRRHGWAVLHLRADPADDDYPILESVAVPLLIVVDYAEQRSAQLSLLARHLARRDQPARVRVLMLARADGEWRTTALDAHVSFAIHATVEGLPPVDATTSDRVEAYTEAAADLATALKSLPDGETHDWAAVAAGLSPAGMDHTLSVLAVQMQALVGLLQAVRPVRVAEGTPAAQILNEHEARYWTKVAEAPPHKLNLAGSTYRAAVAVSSLLPVESPDHAICMLATVPGLRDQPEDQLIKVRNWLAAL